MTYLSGCQTLDVQTPPFLQIRPFLIKKNKIVWGLLHKIYKTWEEFSEMHWHSLYNNWFFWLLQVDVVNLFSHILPYLAALPYILRNVHHTPHSCCNIPGSLPAKYAAYGGFICLAISCNWKPPWREQWWWHWMSRNHKTHCNSMLSGVPGIFPKTLTGNSNVK